MENLCNDYNDGHDSDGIVAHFASMVEVGPLLTLLTLLTSHSPILLLAAFGFSTYEKTDG